MKTNWINIIFATIVSTLLAWSLWTMGIETMQKWLLCFLGGGLIEIGLAGAFGLSFTANRGTVFLKLIGIIMSAVVYVVSVIYSFFIFSAQGYCIPVGIFGALSILLAISICRSKQ